LPAEIPDKDKEFTRLSSEQDFQSPEVWAKVSGKALYGCDLTLPGMLHGKILRSPHPHARILNIDLSAAAGLPGVRAVLSGAELHCKPYGIVVDDELPLAIDRVRYMGDEIAVVAAVEQKTAERALEAIRVDYELLPALFDPCEALADDAPAIHDHFPGNLAWQRTLERGAPEAAFREADLIVEGSFSVPSIHPAYLEPIACLAVYDQYHGLTLHTALQSPDMVRSIVAKVLDLPLSRVRIVGPVMGGGFGGRVYGNLKLYILSGLLAIRTGSPVKMQLTREEEFTVGRPMVAVNIKLKMGLRRDGLILAREADIVTDNGAYSAQAPWVSKTISERNDSVYRIPNIKTRVRLVYTNKIPTGQYRAYGNQAANFATESLIDKAAKELAIDPLELRLKNCTQAGDTTVHGLQIKSCALADCLKKAASEIGWHKRKEGRGYGISAAIHANGSLVFDKNFRGASALARLELDGRVSIFSGEQDYGQGMHGAYTLIAATTLDMAPALITLCSRDTLNTPFSLGALAMRQTTIGGRAVKLAAEDLRSKILHAASTVSGEETNLEGGVVRTTKGLKIDLAEIALAYHRATSGLSLTGEGKYVPPVSDYDQSGYGDIAVTYSFAAHAAEVEIDRATGALTVHRLVAVHDSGRIINHLTARGQVYGGVAQGIGMSCLEGYLFHEGAVANASFADYRIPTALDLPPMEPIFLEKDDPLGPLGAKGIGEIVMVPVPGAIANAVADAAGTWIDTLPITAEKIYRVLAGWECEI
jgi:CO/xanthine dehydrogenase Mo-binding subunit